jgi:hypothetical protein
MINNTPTMFLVLINFNSLISHNCGCKKGRNLIQKSPLVFEESEGANAKIK